MLALVLTLSAQETIAQITVLKACGHHDYPPWNWQSGNKIVGACAELASEAFARLGYQLDLQYVGPWNRCQYLLESGAVDVNICAVSTEDRKSKMMVVNGILGRNEIAAFVKRGTTFSFDKIDDLNGKSVGMVLGVKLGEPLDTYLAQHARIERAPTLESNWKMLQAGRTDLVVMGREGGKAQIDVLGMGDMITDLPYSLSSLDLYVMISKKSAHASELEARLPALGKFFSDATYPRNMDMALKKARANYVVYKLSNGISGAKPDRSIQK
ncbi:substrate-binding periplasmic protein [Undibacterium sp. Ji49W]|uniref:substrate-binding periplasmic protein n=1 Tax=Undibacterium sp. Ji49W TaxID=3413040 RepID=UPI003BF03342